jgi:hypothetical protein
VSLPSVFLVTSLESWRMVGIGVGVGKFGDWGLSWGAVVKEEMLTHDTQNTNLGT